MTPSQDTPDAPGGQEDARARAAATRQVAARRPAVPAATPTTPDSASAPPATPQASPQPTTLQVRAAHRSPLPDTEGTPAPAAGPQADAAHTIRTLAATAHRRSTWSPSTHQATAQTATRPGATLDPDPLDPEAVDFHEPTGFEFATDGEDYGPDLAADFDPTLDGIDDDPTAHEEEVYLDPSSGELVEAIAPDTGRARFPTMEEMRERAANARRAGGKVTPFERWSADDPTFGAYEFADLVSACPLPDYDAMHRTDPYWDALWAANGSGSWTTPETARKHTTAGYGHLPKELTVDKKTAMKTFLNHKGWRSRIAMLGVLHSFRTASAEQIAAFTGDPNLGIATNRDVACTFGSGIVDLGVYANGLRYGSLRGRGARGALLRPAKATTFNRKVLPNLTHAEWMAVTGCQDWTTTGLYDRHNLLATELALRLGEYAPVGAIMGERFSKLNHLAGSGVGRPEIVDSNRSADLTVIRPDGMRVAIELVASVSPTFIKKVRRWVEVLAEQPLENSGLTVVFLVCGTPETVGNPGLTGRAAVYGAVLSALKSFPGDKFNRVAERIGVASWREWFPARHMVSDDFTAMRVDSPVHHLRRFTKGGSDLGPEDIWMQLDFLDPESRPFVCDPSFDATAVIDNSRLLAQTPVWMRDTQPVPDIWLDMFAPYGLEVPVPASRNGGALHMEAKGCVGDTLPPPRLLGLAHAHQLDRSLVIVRPGGPGSFTPPPEEKQATTAA